VQNGTVHLIYLKGDPSASDVYYCRSRDGGKSWSTSIRVNSVPGSAIAMGTIRGAQLALGQGGRALVSWNSSRPAGPDKVWFARMNMDSTGFEPQKNVMTFTCHLDGGSSLAADGRGNVYVGWHANATPEENEPKRQVYLAKSKDDGGSFEAEKPVWKEPTGACGCCQIKLAAEDSGKIWLLYRNARDIVHRDTYLLSSTDGGASFQGAKLDEWQINYCPMSSYAFDFSTPAHFGAWETMEQIHYGVLPDKGLPTVRSAPGSAPRRKYPALASNGAGDTLLAWTEGTAWNRGGNWAYQLLDKNGGFNGEMVSGTGVPAWSYAAVFPTSDGNFELLY
jgi:hypothetical protein